MCGAWYSGTPLLAPQKYFAMLNQYHKIPETHKIRVWASSYAWWHNTRTHTHTHTHIRMHICMHCTHLMLYTFFSHFRPYARYFRCSCGHDQCGPAYQIKIFCFLLLLFIFFFFFARFGCKYKMSYGDKTESGVFFLYFKSCFYLDEINFSFSGR